MKNSVRFLILLIAVILLNSCNTQLHLEKRKYSRGFYVQWSDGKNAHVSTEFAANDAELIVESENNANSVESENTSFSDSVPGAPPSAKSDSLVASTTKHDLVTGEQLSEEMIATPAIPDGGGEQEQKNIRRASVLALTSYILMVVSLLSLLASPLVFGIILTVAFASGITAMIFARRVRKNHEKKEKYPGRWKMICARLVGILVILFAAVTLIVLLGSSVN